MELSLPPPAAAAVSVTTSPAHSPSTNRYSLAEVALHANDEDCWIILHGKVYNVTNFANEHPGGSGIIHKYAGSDATKAFTKNHPRSYLTEYGPKIYQGDLLPLLPTSTPSQSIGSSLNLPSSSSANSKAHLLHPQTAAVKDTTTPPLDMPAPAISSSSSPEEQGSNCNIS